MADRIRPGAAPRDVLARRTRIVAVVGVVCAVSVLAGAILAASIDRSNNDRTVATDVPSAGVQPWTFGNPFGAPSPIAADSPVTGATPPGDAPVPPPPRAPAASAHPRTGGTHTSPQPSPTKASPTPAGPVTRVYEAESSGNTFGGGAQPEWCGPCSGGRDVRWVGYGGTLQVNGVTSAAGGSATLTISYVNGDATRWCLISVDGGNGTWLSFPSTGSWDAVGAVTVPIGLHVGTNRFLFATNRNWCPDFDRFAVRQ